MAGRKVSLFCKMKLHCKSFFPDLQNFREIHLNKFWKYHCEDNRPASIERELGKLRCNTFGGYGENRKDIWSGTYLDEQKNYTHLGIDINVTAGTPIYCPFTCGFIEFLKDKDQDIGWGMRLILERKNCPYYLVLAHLDPSYLPNVCYKKYKGDLLGFVGAAPTNGNVFSHLHIQCIKIENVNNFDGYGFRRDLKNNPNPFQIEF